MVDSRLEEGLFCLQFAPRAAAKLSSAKGFSAGSKCGTVAGSIGAQALDGRDAALVIPQPVLKTLTCWPMTHLPRKRFVESQSVTGFGLVQHETSLQNQR